ncbi:MAG: thioredoxin domain-containing protein [Opitutaceae bacterium]
MDEEWLVPHFEKMLYDQAQIAVNALETWQATGDERLAWIVRDILEYVLRDLADPAGGFYSGEDADSERPEGGHGEGAFYVWTAGEIDSALRAKGSPAAELVRLHFGVRAEGNVPPDRDPQREMAGRNILAAAGGLSESARRLGIPLQEASDRLTGALDILREVRARRPRPARDEKVLTAWNGLMISALARAAAAPAESLADRRAAYLEAAGRAARFVREALWDEASRSLFRSWRRFGDHPERSRRADAPGFAEDYADLIQGLLDLYEAGFDPAWLQWADRLQERMDERFWDEASGGYFSSDAGAADIIVRLKDDYDGAEPAPSSVAAMNLFRLEAMLGGGGNAPRRLTGLRTLEAFRARWMEHPEALPQMLCALELALDAPRHVVLAGDPDAPGFRALAEVVRENLGPFRSLMAAPPDAPATADSRSWLASRAPWLAGMRPVDGRPAAYVCENFACRAPVTDPAALRKALAATTEPEGRSR